MRPTSMQPQINWNKHNSNTVNERFRELAALPDGVLDSLQIGETQWSVEKRGSIIELITSARITSIRSIPCTKSGVMSCVDLTDPLRIDATYAEMLMLSLLWQPQPESVYIIGFGGGRIPMVLHHFFPDLRVQSTEIEQTAVQMAFTYFGISVDERMKVILDDGLAYLARCTEKCGFDIIMIDCFSPEGIQPGHFSTSQFYQLCRRKLRDSGVVTTHLRWDDPLLSTKRRRLLVVFICLSRFTCSLNCALRERSPVRPKNDHRACRQACVTVRIEHSDIQQFTHNHKLVVTINP